jgi:hypothetical protein
MHIEDWTGLTAGLDAVKKSKIFASSGTHSHINHLAATLALAPYEYQIKRIKYESLFEFSAPEEL